MSGGPAVVADLDLPAHPDALVVLRATVSALAALAGLTLDDIDDCEIAVEEAGAVILAAGADRLRLQVRVGDGAVHVGVAPGEPAGHRPSPDLTAGLAWRILSGVAEQVMVDGGEIHFSKTTSAS